MKTNSLSAWILAVRPYSLGNSVILVLVGSALARTDGSFHWLPALLCLLFAVAGEALFDFRTRNRDLIDSDRIVAAAVHQRCKIVFHW